MNTPAHLLLGAALLTRRKAPTRNIAVLTGAMLPDLSLYLMAGVSLFVLNLPPSVVFGELYYSPAWQIVFAIDNSAVLWGALALVSLWRHWDVASGLSLAALTHIATDFPLHHDDGRSHFWPVSSWVFESPVSYWDSAHHAGFVAPFTLCLCVGCAFVLWRRFPGLVPRLGVGLLVGMELWVARQWILFF